jgi:hypothetical protein
MRLPYFVIQVSGLVHLVVATFCLLKDAEAFKETTDKYADMYIVTDKDVEY